MRKLVCPSCGSDRLYSNCRVEAYERGDGTRFLTGLTDAEPDRLDCGSCGVDLKLGRLGWDGDYAAKP